MFQHLMTDLVDHVLDHLAGILDEVDDRKQDLTIALAELLDDGGRLAPQRGSQCNKFSSRR